MEIQAQLEASLSKIESTLSGKIDQVNAESGKVSAKAMGEINSLGQQFKELQDEVTALAQKGFASAPEQKKTIGEQFANSDSFKAFAGGQANRANFTFQANTVLSGKDDVIVPFDRKEGIVPGPMRALTILDFINKGSTTQDTIRYTKETAFTNNAAETAQGAQKPESDITFEAVNAPVQTIPTFLKISKQVMDDAPAVQSYINTRLRHGVQQRLDSQIINGDGAGTNLSGILQNSTAFAVGTAANAFDYTNAGKYAVMGSDYMPDFWFVNPADWGSLFETIKRGAADAAYVGSSGAVSYVNEGLTPMLWGIPVVASNAVPAGTAIGGSSDAMMLWMRDDVNIQAFEQDENNVQLNLVTIRAEMRAAFTVFRDDALITLDLTTLPV
jgi:HK97 family phage major capsid protein